MTWIDISLPISAPSVVWPGAPATQIEMRRSMARGDKSNNSNLFMNCHTGTHIDAPFHFIANGKTAEQLSLDILMGEVWVADLSKTDTISITELEAHWPKHSIDRLLIKTKNSQLWREKNQTFAPDFVALEEAATRWLLDRKIKCIGIDYLSIQRYKDPPIVHQLLLEAEVVVIEGLDLFSVTQGKYEMACLPLKIVGADGAPARVALKPL